MVQKGCIFWTPLPIGNHCPAGTFSKSGRSTHSRFQAVLGYTFCYAAWENGSHRVPRARARGFGSAVGMPNGHPAADSVDKFRGTDLWHGQIGVDPTRHTRFVATRVAVPVGLCGPRQRLRQRPRTASRQRVSPPGRRGVGTRSVFFVPKWVQICTQIDRPARAWVQKVPGGDSWVQKCVRSDISFSD